MVIARLTCTALQKQLCASPPTRVSVSKYVRLCPTNNDYHGCNSNRDNLESIEGLNQHREVKQQFSPAFQNSTYFMATLTSNSQGDKYFTNYGALSTLDVNVALFELIATHVVEEPLQYDCLRGSKI